MVDVELYIAFHAMTALYRSALDEVGLTYPQYVVLRVLWQEGVIQVRDLGRILHLTVGTTSPLLKKLEALGFVHRTRGTVDGRTLYVGLTDAGSELLDRLADLPENLGRGVGITPSDYHHLHDLSGRLRGRRAAPGEGAVG